MNPSRDNLKKKKKKCRSKNKPNEKLGGSKSLLINDPLSN